MLNKIEALEFIRSEQQAVKAVGAEFEKFYTGACKQYEASLKINCIRESKDYIGEGNVVEMLTLCQTRILKSDSGRNENFQYIQSLTDYSLAVIQLLGVRLTTLIDLECRVETHQPFTGLEDRLKVLRDLEDKVKATYESYKLSWEKAGCMFQKAPEVI